MRRWLLILPVLAGCASEPTVRTVVVEVPVDAGCPAPPPAVRPALPIAGITPDSPDADVMQAYVVSVAVLKGYCGELETVLDGYRDGGK